jgi:hypothetical protein
MRSVYSAIFIGFAAVGFAGVFNAHNSAGAASPNPEVTTAQPATNSSSFSVGRPEAAIRVQTELVEPDIIHSTADGTRRVAPPPSKERQPGRIRVRMARSLFARVVFGDGEFRPQPFPTPAQQK